MRAAILLVLLAAGPTTADVPPGSAGVAAESGAAPAASLLRSAVAIEATQRIPLVPDTEVVVDPRAAFEIELTARLPDARLVLLDGHEDLVPSTSSRELSAGTRLTLSLTAPLIGGTRYALRVDGASQRDLRDEAGRAFAPLTLPIVAAGSPPPPEPKRPVRRKRR